MTGIEFAEVCREAQVVADKCVGAWIYRVSMAGTWKQDFVDLLLTEVPDLGEVTISMERIWWFKMEGLVYLNGAFIDTLSINHLPRGDAPWPSGAEKLVYRIPSLPDLVWLHIDGPSQVDIVSSIISIATKRVAS